MSKKNQEKETRKKRLKQNITFNIDFDDISKKILLKKKIISDIIYLIKVNNKFKDYDKFSQKLVLCINYLKKKDFGNYRNKKNNCQ